MITKVNYLVQFLVLVPPLACAYYFVQKYYRASSRELQRLDTISKSFASVYTSVTELGAGGASRNA